MQITQRWTDTVIVNNTYIVTLLYSTSIALICMVLVLLPLLTLQLIHSLPYIVSYIDPFCLYALATPACCMRHDFTLHIVLLVTEETNQLLKR